MVNLFVLGVGKVGSAFCRQVLGLPAATRSRVRLSALADTRGVVSAPDGLSDDQVRRALQAKTTGQSFASVPGALPAGSANEVVHTSPRRMIVIDLTASDEVLPLLLDASSMGHGIVLVNKRPITSSQSAWDALTTRGRLRYEATVGAGLPVIYTLDYLQRTGDVVAAVEGMLSGTLGYVMSRMEEGDSYSAAVAGAADAGYTEPDPRDDLGGMDMARKALILARTIGVRAELEDIRVTPLFPSHLAEVPVLEFLSRSVEGDAKYAELVAGARERGEVLRYLAHVGADGLTVGLQSLPAVSPFGSLSGADNLISIATSRYNPSPLRIAGPGAGVEVTAAAVLQDVLSLTGQITAEEGGA